MHEGGALTWREVVDKYHSVLVEELSVRIDSDLKDAVKAHALAVTGNRNPSKLCMDLLACDDARRSRVESLNQVLRRLRSASDEDVPDHLAESRGVLPTPKKLVVLVFENNQGADCAASAGVQSGPSGLDDTDSASAIVAAIARQPGSRRCAGNGSRNIGSVDGGLRYRAG